MNVIGLKQLFAPSITYHKSYFKRVDDYWLSPVEKFMMKSSSCTENNIFHFWTHFSTPPVTPTKNFVFRAKTQNLISYNIAEETFCLTFGFDAQKYQKLKKGRIWAKNQLISWEWPGTQPGTRTFRNQGIKTYQKRSSISADLRWTQNVLWPLDYQGNYHYSVNLTS